MCSIFVCYAQRGESLCVFNLLPCHCAKTETGPFIIRFQGVTSTQDYKNILVEHDGMKVTDLRLNKNVPKALHHSQMAFFY